MRVYKFLAVGFAATVSARGTTAHQTVLDVDGITQLSLDLNITAKSITPFNVATTGPVSGKPPYRGSSRILGNF